MSMNYEGSGFGGRRTPDPNNANSRSPHYTSSSVVRLNRASSSKSVQRPRRVVSLGNRMANGRCDVRLLRGPRKPARPRKLARPTGYRPGKKIDIVIPGQSRSPNDRSPLGRSPNGRSPDGMSPHSRSPHSISPPVGKSTAARSIVGRYTPPPLLRGKTQLIKKNLGHPKERKLLREQSAPNLRLGSPSNLTTVQEGLSFTEVVSSSPEQEKSNIRRILETIGFRKWRTRRSKTKKKTNHLCSDSSLVVKKRSTKPKNAMGSGGKSQDLAPHDTSDREPGSVSSRNSAVSELSIAKERRLALGQSISSSHLLVNGKKYWTESESSLSRESESITTVSSPTQLRSPFSSSNSETAIVMPSLMLQTNQKHRRQKRNGILSRVLISNPRISGETEKKFMSAKQQKEKSNNLKRLFAKGKANEQSPKVRGGWADAETHSKQKIRDMDVHLRKGKALAPQSSVESRKPENDGANLVAQIQEGFENKEKNREQKRICGQRQKLTKTDSSPQDGIINQLEIESQIRTTDSNSISKKNSNTSDISTVSQKSKKPSYIRTVSLEDLISKLINEAYSVRNFDMYEAVATSMENEELRAKLGSVEKELGQSLSDINQRLNNTIIALHTSTALQQAATSILAECSLDQSFLPLTNLCQECCVPQLRKSFMKVLRIVFTLDSSLSEGQRRLLFWHTYYQSAHIVFECERRLLEVKRKSVWRQLARVVNARMFISYGPVPPPPDIEIETEIIPRYDQSKFENLANVKQSSEKLTDRRPRVIDDTQHVDTFDFYFEKDDNK
mmetsp:Transcript_28809/g.70262  ORF Transcript_28809/g.70262 Transcript_28809/m.70262 type:complete len:786 (-) Transcript_28809:95-2452(-)